MTKRTRFDATGDPLTVRALAAAVDRLTSIVDRLIGREVAFLEPQQQTISVSVLLPRRLTKRETEIARMIADGMGNEQIADALCLSFDTVRSHRANLYKRLGVHSVAELIGRRGEWEG